ncbi:HBL260Cp [Eremothecium sinecaudum]|uniref:HBL260Cp n=1 Tax=Eremothecium sinecaudum TaxID=45286 RepID=A0A109UWJ1_9SACH|nr:HBL260Cp [Eremothecium sinecaudum]AMD18642.1 HBL260Cp [Eremothecium sinecaudum]
MEASKTNNCVTSMAIKGDKRRSLLGQYLLKKYEKLISTDTGVVNGRDPEPYSNLGLVTNIAGSFVDATLERLKGGKEVPGRTLEEDLEEFALQEGLRRNSEMFWKDENFRNEYEIGGESDDGQFDIGLKSGQILGMKFHDHEHFIDILLDKVISALLPEELPEREQLTLRVNEAGRKKSQHISVMTISRNFKILTSKMALVFEFQDSVIRLITWRSPSSTILILMLHTFICFNPMLLPVFALSYVLFGLMVTGYLHRHPLRRSYYLSKHSYGTSLLEAVFSGGKRTTWHGHDNVHEHDYSKIPTECDWQKMHNIQHAVEFIVNLRDLQNLMSSIVLVTEKLEMFVYGEAGFKNEHRSTILFLMGLVLLTLLWFCSPLMNWSIAAAVLAWGTMIVIHPKVLPRLSALIDEEQIEHGKAVVQNAERYDIILDEAPEVQYLELFEIHKQGLMPHQWEFYIYSSYIFDPQDKYRKQQAPPPGVLDLDQVCPPPTWSFDKNSDWEVDYNAKAWAKERGLNLEVKNEYVVDRAFKRRRLTRKVLRYANSARRPSYR